MTKEQEERKARLESHVQTRTEKKCLSLLDMTKCILTRFIVMKGARNLL